MRHLIKLFLGLSLVMSASAVDVWYISTDFNLNTNAFRKVVQTPLEKFADYNGAILTPTPKIATNDGNGFVVFSNTVPGYAYRLQIYTAQGITTRTAGFPATLTGYVRGRDYLGNIYRQDFYYLYPQIVGISNAYSGSFTGLVSAANGSVLSNALWFGELGARTGAYIGIGGQFFLTEQDDNGTDRLVIQDVNYGGEIRISGGTNYGIFVGDGSGLTNIPSSAITGGGAGIPTLNGIGTNTALTNFVYLLGTNVYAQSNNVGHLWVTNETTLANGVAGVTATGVYFSNKGANGHFNNFVAGDPNNAVSSDSDYSSVLGGSSSTISAANADNDVIVGGENQAIRGGLPSSVGQSTIVGGSGNVIETNDSSAVQYAVVLGGKDNLVRASYGVAAGRQARVIDQGAFVLSDSTAATFASVGADTIAMRFKSFFMTNDDAAGHYMSVSNGVLTTSVGLLVKSNTLASIPTLAKGDIYFWASNGIAYVICSSPTGTLTTNKLGP